LVTVDAMQMLTLKSRSRRGYAPSIRGRCPHRRVLRRKEVAMVDLPSQPLGDIDPEFQKIALETGEMTYGLSETSCMRAGRW
jgi:hypothetical protein